MSLMLNVLLLILGTVATLAAFGGDTWTNSPDPLLKRITPRGWISLLCLACALILGSLKEINSASSDRAVRQERDEAQRKLATANSKLDTVGKDLELTKTKLSAANDLLDALAKNLTSAREQLSRQAEINLITVLSNNNPVKEAAWWIELQGESRQASDIGEYLFSKIRYDYSAIAKGEIQFHPYLGVVSILDYTWEKGKLAQWHPGLVGHGFVAPETVVPDFLDSSRIWPASERKRSQSVYIITQKVADNDLASAAIAYRDLMRQGAVGQVSLTFGRTFKTREEAHSFLAANRSFRPTKEWHELVSDTYSAEFELPNMVASEFTRYWSVNLRRSHMHLYLQNSASLMISCDVAIKETKRTVSGITLVFKPTSQPKIEVGIEEF